MHLMKPALAKTTSDQAYINIRDKIISTVLKPGQKISEKELAEEFGISRTPVREALMRLSYDGFVEIFAQRGTYVTPINRDTVMAAHYARSVLECALVQNAATCCDSKDIQWLEQNLSEQKHVFESGRFSEIERLDEDFHQKIAIIAGYTAVWDIIYHVRLHIDRVRMLFLEKSRIPQIIKEHEAIVNALAASDGENAVAAMKSHLQFFEANIDRLALSYAAYR